MYGDLSIYSAFVQSILVPETGDIMDRQSSVEKNRLLSLELMPQLQLTLTRWSIWDTIATAAIATAAILYGAYYPKYALCLGKRVKWLYLATTHSEQLFLTS
jgi:hypothetical protein